MKPLNLILLWIFMLAPLLSTAQDKPALPLREVLLQLEKKHKVTFNYLDNDLSGIALIPPKDALSLNRKIAYLMETTALEFRFITPKTISISKRTAQLNPQNPVTETLEEVVISKYLTTGIHKKADGSFLIKPQQFGMLPGVTEADVLQTMQQIPGIISVDETISNSNVRGGTQDQNLFVWNGIRMFQTGHFFGLISAFNPLVAQDIQIYKNGSPAFLGESVSSAVRISTKTDTVPRTKSAAEVNLISAAFFSRIKLSQKASVLVAARRSLTDFVATPTYQNYAQRIFQNTIVTNLSANEPVDYAVSEKFYFYDLSVQYQQKVASKHELVIDAISINNDLNLTQRPQSSGNRTRASSLGQQNFGANLHWKTKWNANHTTTLNSYGSYYKLAAESESGGRPQRLTQQNSVLLTGASIENRYRLNGNFEFNSGYEFSETGITNLDRINVPQFSRKIKDVLRVHSAVLEAGFVSDDRKIALKAGLRTSYIEKFQKSLFEPRLRFGYGFSTKLKLEVLGEMKSQTASQVIDLQRDFLGIEKRRWLLADDNKNPIQQSKQLSVGLVFSDAKWLLTVDNFYKRINGISSTGQSFQNQLEFLKINGSYTVWGSELLVQRNYNRFYSWISYSRNHNRYEFPDFVPPNFPNNFAISHSVACAAIYDYNQLKIALGARWFSGKPETTPLTVDPDAANPTIIYNDPNNSNLPDYFQLNASVARKWTVEKNTELTLALSVQNLLNRKNQLNRYYRINTTQNTVESVATYSLKRTPNLSVKYAF